MHCNGNGSFGDERLSNLTRRLFMGAGAATLLVPKMAFAQEKPVRGGTLTFVVSTDPTMLTHIDRNGPEPISNKILEGLIDFDPELRPIPALATSWEMSEDGLRYTFKLRSGVKWHDGKDFTSADVAYSIKTLKELHPRRRATFANVTEIETPDPLTATIVLSRPAPFLMGALAASSSPVFPKHLYEGRDFATNPVNSAPVGTGPFIFKEWVKGSHVLVERNPNYWDSPKPYVDRIVTRFISDAGTRTAALEAGEVDVGNYSPVPFGDIERIKEVPHLEVITDGYRRLGAQNQCFFNLDNPILAKLEVRQALAHAIDTQQVLDVAWYGYGSQSPSAIGKSQPDFHDASIKPYTYDPDLCRKMLDQAGYPEKDGTRFPLRILYAPWLDSFKRAAEVIRGQLREVGIGAELSTYDYATFATRVYNERNFDIDVEGLSTGYDPTDGVQRVYWSKAFKKGLQFSNPCHYVNPEVDELIENAAVETNKAKRSELYRKMQQIIYEDVPLINMVAQDTFTVLNKRVKNVMVSADGVNASLADAYLS